MNTFTGSLPIGTIRACVSALNGYRKELAKLRDQKKEYEAPDASRKYSQEHIEKELIRIDAETMQINDEAAKKVSNFYEMASAEVKDAFIPLGSDVTAENEADAALFKNGLILDKNTLEYMINKHDNAAFRIMAANYAKERNWDGFEYTTHEKAAGEYVEQVFRELKNVASSPFGFSAIQYTETPGEYRRMADAYGLVAEFNKGGGDSIDSAVLSESLGAAE